MEKSNTKQEKEETSHGVSKEKEKGEVHRGVIVMGELSPAVPAYGGSAEATQTLCLFVFRFFSKVVFNFPLIFFHKINSSKHST